jgi:hypothetical protein
MRYALTIALLVSPFACTARAADTSGKIDFNRDIRPILSNACLKCHGPDPQERQGGGQDGLRLDVEESALADLGGYAAIVRGKPGDSELIERITSDDADLLMPPKASGKQLSEHEVALLTKWIEQGAPFARHWSYVKPVRPPAPEVQDRAWPRNAIDAFLLARLEREGRRPSPEADRYALIRRVTLDITGLPPTVEEVDQFVADARPDAYDQLVDRLLAGEAYGEHWARLWLDLARYADSAGYADDPPRTIWAFRDYVIRSLNANKPFDQFTIEQIAGDLLPDPTEEQLIATAFHRNTLTNNEGGTNDEEFRNVAVVDRVNTTMAVWMGTTMACAQCHSHKYDPLTQEEYFRFFALLNNSEDADRGDESPLLTIWSDEQKRQKADWQAEIDQLEQTLRTATPELLAAQSRWEQTFAQDLNWQVLTPAAAKSQAGVPISTLDDGSLLVGGDAKTDVVTLEFAVEPAAASGGDFVNLSALRLEALPHESLPSRGPGHASGNFVLSRVVATVAPPQDERLAGRFVRIEIPGPQKMLSLAEVQVFRGADNLAMRGQASQSSTDFDGPAQLAIDGNTNGHFADAKSTTHTAVSDDPWWEVDLQSAQPIDRIVLWNRTDNNLHTRLANFRLAVLNENREPVWERTVAESPSPSAEYALDGVRSLAFTAAYADFAQSGFDPMHVINNPDPNAKGWAISPQAGQPHALTLIAAAPVLIPAGSRLTVVLEQVSKFERATLGRFRVAATGDVRAVDFARTPPGVLAILKTPESQRSDAQQGELTRHFLSVADELRTSRERLETLKKQLTEMKPATTLPILRELPAERKRTTNVQYRGNFLDLGPEVEPGVPAALHPLPAGASADRLGLARWLVGENNPLTARVVANRYWEQLFGIGLVRTSEEFGSQGELPTHPELLDWLATELVQQKWDLKYMVKLLVTSAAYRQSSRVTPELQERDPENVLLARGPRFRLTSEVIRDQALAVSGLLSRKMYGPPVKPPQPSLGLSAAFGSGIDWKTSEGEDRYRRGLYTTWRRSSPYPSLAAFDAPNREVCTLRRDRTNTPLQALVTLNDPVYIEAAQSLARRMIAAEGDVNDKVRYGFRLCAARPPSDAELARLVQLYEAARQRFGQAPDQGRQFATDPLGPPPDGAEISDLAAWTMVGNVLLNLDEMLMKR